LLLFYTLHFFGYISVNKPQLDEAPPIMAELSVQDTLYKNFDTTPPKSLNN
jgi:hypothetical protein